MLQGVGYGVSIALLVAMGVQLLLYARNPAVESLNPIQLQTVIGILWYGLFVVVFGMVVGAILGFCNGVVEWVYFVPDPQPGNLRSWLFTAFVAYFVLVLPIANFLLVLGFWYVPMPLIVQVSTFPLIASSAATILLWRNLRRHMKT